MEFSKIIKNIEEYNHIGDKFSLQFINQFLKCVSEYYQLYRNHSIVPNKNGIFCKIDDLFVDDNIPDIFKECLKKCFDEDINKELIDDRIDAIKPLGKKKIIDYKSILEKYFNMKENKNKKNKGNSQYLPLEEKKKAAKYLIRIIPKKLKDKDKLDSQDNQRKLFKIYKFFTGNDDEPYEIERNEYNYSICYF